MAKKSKKIVDNVNNGLGDVVLQGINPFGNSTPLTQTDPFFANNRWYLISNMRQALSQGYAEHGLIQAVVNVPVEDAVRGGIDIKTTQLDQTDIDNLQATLEDEGVIEECANAMKWMRLFGGGGILFMTGQDHTQPMIMEQAALKGMEIRGVDLWELFWTMQNIDDPQGKLELKSDKDFKYSYYGLQVHNTRVLPLKGIVAPSFIRPRLRGWGLSVIEGLVMSINQFMKTKNLTYEVLDEFKMDIFKIKGFNSALMTDEGTNGIVKRVQLANQQKNYQNALTMDTEDDHISKQLSFAGIADILKELRMQVACDTRIPMSRLFGIASSGFSSGEDDLAVYEGMVESEVRFKLRRPLTQVVKMYCMRDFGIMPDDLRIEFKPLRVMTAEQEENVKNSKLNRVLQVVSGQLCSGENATEAINKDNLIGVKVDATSEIYTPSGTESTKIGEEDTQSGTKSAGSVNESMKGESTDEFKKSNG